MIMTGTVSVDDLDDALKCLLLEASRRDMETAKSCYWKMKDGGLITLGSMSDSHLENTSLAFSPVLDSAKATP